MPPPSATPDWPWPTPPPTAWTFDLDSRATHMSVVTTSQDRAPVFATPDAIAQLTGLFPRSSGVPEEVEALLDISRKLLQTAPVHYEFAAIGVEKSLQALELAVRTRLGASHRPTFAKLLESLAEQGLVSESDLDMINTGRELRNRIFAHPTNAVAVPMVLAMGLAERSHGLIALLFPEDT